MKPDWREVLVGGIVLGMERAHPPDDISPAEFFTCWLPDVVAQDEARRSRLKGTDAVIEFALDGGGVFTVRIADGRVSGAPGASENPDLRVALDIATWRKLNSGEVSAPEAVLKRQLTLKGDFLLGLKLHLILG